MIFNSFEFFIFLPVVFLLYWFVFANNLRWQNAFVVLASYVFYGWWDVRFLILIAITTLLSYLSGLLIVKCKQINVIGGGKILLIANIVINLGILGYYKYSNFFIENFIAGCHAIGLDPNLTLVNVVLPVGISFYTFQALSYSIDVYKGKIQATREPLAFFAFVSFFPQLVAGPIERATNLLPQFLQKRTFDYAKAVDGSRQMLWGFFKKMVVADNCAVAANLIWSDYTNQSGFTLFMGAVLFTFQIYGDFSGYSDIAIGCARLFGIDLKRNFNFPYFSRDIAEFWRRWHISLTKWFTDYIYIPLGGSRCGKAKQIRNTFIIFLVSGFWHGANWTFIIWGLYHAILFLPLLLLGKNRKNVGDTVAAGRLIPTLKESGQIILTFLLVVVGWIIFRAENITQALDYIQRMCSVGLLDISSWTIGRRAMLYTFILLIVEWFHRSKQHGLQLSNNGLLLRTRVVRIVFYWLFVLFVFLFAGTQQEFIYFQF